jgi:hypothetical protein
MNPAEKLITLARRYCLFQIRHRDHYWEIHDPKTETSYPLDIPVRAALSESILEDLERITDKPFATVEECKEEIKSFGLNRKQDPENLNESGDTPKEIKRSLSLMKVNNNAVQHFLYFINGISDEQMDTVEPLPYKRRLADQESEEIRAGLKTHWQFDGFYWVPLMGNCLQPLLIFEDDELTADRLPELKGLISSWSPQRIYEIEEWGNNYELDATEFDPDKTEVLYTSKDYSWVIYTSHEATVALGGKWLLAEMERKFAAIIKPGNRRQTT